MALTTVSSDRLSTNVKTSNLGTELKKKVGQNKNIIINGACLISQRGTSTTSPGYGTVDRYKLLTNGCDDAPTQSQADVASGTTPYTLGFRKSYKITNGNQTSGAGAADYIFFRQQLEAQDIANSGWNYLSSSSNITLSFWVKSSVAQNFYGYVRSHDGTSYVYPFETGALTADTWTKVTKTIPGNSNLQFDNDVNTGFGVNFAPFQGTDYTASSVTLNAWAAYASGTKAPDYTSTWFTTNNATFEITGLQLEVGSVATDFEHRSFGQELALCQRYYQQYTNIMSVGYVPNNVSKSYSHGFNLPVEMRAAPTLTISNTGSTAGQYVTDGDTNRNVSSLDSHASQTYQIEYYFNLSGDLSDFRGAYAVSSTSTTHQTTYYITAEL